MKRRYAVSLAAALAVATLLGGRAEAAAPSISVRGRGWGHGVGMSQYGARGLADSGWTGNRILALFYRGTALQKLTTPSIVRVGVIQEQDHIDFTGNGRFDILDHLGHVRATGASGQTWTSRPIAAGTTQLGVYDPNGALSFTSQAPVTIVYENFRTLASLPQVAHQYKHGSIALDVNSSTNRERVVLTLPFEQYLYGLGEMPASWNMEALKAQAIAGRTYALEKITRLGQYRSVCNCGMYASTADQAYVGVSQEVSRWVSAVDSTRSQVSTYGGKPIQAYYSSSDGGFTENNENVFGGDPLPYLRGVCDPGDYDNGSNPNANWMVTLPADQMGQRLAAGGFNVGVVQELTILDPRGVSGRVLKVVDSTHGGMRVRGTTSTARMSGEQFRSLVGLRSTFIAHSITGAIRARYDREICRPGFPKQEPYVWRDVSGTSRGAAQDFSNGRIFENGSTHVANWIWGPILARYDSIRSQHIDFGLPTSGVFSVTGGARANFEHGYITWTYSNGATRGIRT